MSLTKEEWEWIRERLTEGCRFVYKSTYDIGSFGATIRLGGASHTIGERFRAQFDNPEYAQEWSLHGMNKCYAAMSLFTWPDGRPMIPFVEYDGKPYNPILAKIKSLEARFAAKTLNKTTQKALALP